MNGGDWRDSGVVRKCNRRGAEDAETDAEKKKLI
jgi:hypothetical protein